MAATVSDTQNKAWAQNKNAFGFKMLTKMGWSEGKGLGKHESGMATHVKVKRRAEQLGIGAETDKTGNVALLTAVQDYNTLLAHISKTTKLLTEDAQSGDEAASYSGFKRKRQETPSSSEDDAASPHVPCKKTSRVHYTRHVRNKDVSRYSAHDLSAILGVQHPGNSKPAVPASDEAPVHKAKPTELATDSTDRKNCLKDTGAKRRRRRASDASSSSSSSSDSSCSD